MKKQIEYVPLPPECITFQKRDYWLDQRIQLTPLGKEIRYSGIRINEDMPNKYGKYHWIYTFIYLDGSGLIEFECDYENKIKIYVRECYPEWD
jgi:hypothetical protein